jgi:hypothetical protein
MNGGTKTGFGTISLERLQCARRDSAGPTERRRRRNTTNINYSGKTSYFTAATNNNLPQNTLLHCVCKQHIDFENIISVYSFYAFGYALLSPMYLFITLFLSLALQPSAGYGLLVNEVS